MAGCSPDPTMKMGKLNVSHGRFEIDRIEVFSDELAYDGQRGIYLIKDSKTGSQYVGISGIGISSLGHHSTGKTTSLDER